MEESIDPCGNEDSFMSLNHCTGYAPCENGDWLLFAPGDGVLHRVIGKPGDFAPRLCWELFYFGRVLIIYGSER